MFSNTIVTPSQPVNKAVSITALALLIITVIVSEKIQPLLAVAK